jgi:hypothetical protein
MRMYRRIHYVECRRRDGGLVSVCSLRLAAYRSRARGEREERLHTSVRGMEIILIAHTFGSLQTGSSNEDATIPDEGRCVRRWPRG